MVSVDFDLMAEQDVPVGFQGLHDRQQLTFSGRVACLSVVELSAIERYRFSILGDDSAQLVMASIRMDGELLGEVGICQD